MEHNKNQKVLQIAMDMDGCLLPTNIVSSENLETCYIVAECLESEFLKRNKVWIKSLIKEIVEQNTTLVVISLQSNRQDFLVDHQNGMKGKNGTCMPILPLVQNILQAYLFKKANCEVIFDSTLMSDIYSFKAAGESYMEIISCYYRQPNFSKNLPRFIFEEDKTLRTYLDMHRLAVLYPHAEKTIKIYDDNLQILERNYQLFSKFPQLRPDKLNIQFYQYKGDGSGELIREIEPEKNTSIHSTDHKYPWSVLLMALSDLEANSVRDSYGFADFEGFLNKGLQEYLNIDNNRYLGSWNPYAFFALRDKIIHKLNQVHPMEHKPMPACSTADQLKAILEKGVENDPKKSKELRPRFVKEFKPFHDYSHESEKKPTESLSDLAQSTSINAVSKNAGEKNLMKDKIKSGDEKYRNLAYQGFLSSKTTQAVLKESPKTAAEKPKKKTKSLADPAASGPK